MRDLTSEQRAAVERRDGALLLAAAAGSGKTSVLVERFVAAVEHDGIAPGRILAITFTDRAAGELRERVRARFEGAGLREAARDTEAAFVGTIHGFCQRLLRAHALEAGLDPAFSVLDEPRAAHLRSLAFRVALGEWLAGESAAGAVDLAAAYGPDRLATMIAAVHEELRSRGQREPVLPPVDGPPGPSTAQAAATLLSAARAAAAELDAANSASPGRRKREALEAMQRALDLLEPLARGGEDHAGPALSALGDLALPGGLGNGGASVGCDEYRAALEALRQSCADRDGAAACRLLDGLLGRYGQRYAEAKRMRGVVDFDDLELLARDLLRSDQGVRESWAQRFALLMVDEFQDTNPRQMGILNLLARDNLFTVGDEFQSIYGFRHADVGLFRERRRELAARGASLALARNFRARRAILDVVNAAFAPLFGANFTPLLAGREDADASPAAGDDEPLVELLVTDRDGWEAEDSPLSRGDPLPPAKPWRQAEARLLAQRIADLIGAGQAQPGEVAVLVRAVGDIPVYERALEDRGLPTLAAGAGGYWSHQQVTDLLAYLAALANPLDERALFSLMASPMVGLSSDALAIAARAGTEQGAGTWAALSYAFVSGAGAPWLERLAERDRERLAGFCPLFARERAAAARRSIAQLLQRALAMTGYEHWVLTRRWGERRLANVHKLLRLARAYESTEGRDLRGFLDHATRQAEAQAREAEAPVEDADLQAVRLMTIHAAKGLEFGVVAVADLGRQAYTDTPELLVDGERLGLRLAALDGSRAVPALQFAMLRAERLEAEALEEQRILYVAMTRARERLLLSGAASLDPWPGAGPGRPQINWLGPALVEGLAERAPEESMFDASPPGVPEARVRCWISRPDAVGEALREESLLAAARPAVPGEQDEPAIAAQPPAADRPAAVATSALSYSALADYERCGYRYYLERVLRLPPEQERSIGGVGSAAGGLDPRTRGSLVHRLLESVDFAALAAPSGEEVARVARELGVAPRPTELRGVAELVAALTGTELAARLASAPRLSREVPFAFSVGPDEPLLNGVIDALANELGGGCLVVDYKSDDVAADEDLEALTELQYGIQRRIYALAALRAGALEVDVVHWYLQRPSEPVSARFVAADAESLVAGLQERMRSIGQGSFEVSPLPHAELCLGCPGRRSLCSWDEEHTSRPRPPLHGGPAGYGARAARAQREAAAGAANGAGMEESG